MCAEFYLPGFAPEFPPRYPATTTTASSSSSSSLPPPPPPPPAPSRPAPVRRTREEELQSYHERVERIDKQIKKNEERIEDESAAKNQLDEFLENFEMMQSLFSEVSGTLIRELSALEHDFCRDLSEAERIELGHRVAALGINLNQVRITLAVLKEARKHRIHYASETNAKLKQRKIEIASQLLLREQPDPVEEPEQPEPEPESEAEADDEEEEQEPEPVTPLAAKKLKRDPDNDDDDAN